MIDGYIELLVVLCLDLYDFGFTHTDGMLATAWRQNSSRVADNKYIPLNYYSIAWSNSHGRQFAVDNSDCRRLTPVWATKKTLTCSCVVATAGRRFFCRPAATASTLLIPRSSLPLSCRPSRLQVAVDLGGRQPQLAVDLGDTNRQYKRQRNCKIVANMPSVWV